MADAEAVSVLANEYSRRVADCDETSADELREAWELAGFDPDRDTRVWCEADGAVVAYAQCWDIVAPHVDPHFYGRVRGTRAGRGLWDRILDWYEARGALTVTAAPEGARVAATTTAPEADADARGRLEARGWREVRRYRLMEIDIDDEPPAPCWPEGITLVPFVPERDLRAFVTAVEECFRDQWGHVVREWEEVAAVWEQWVAESPLFDASLWFMAKDGDEIAGAVHGQPCRTGDPDCGWVEALGVRRPWRRCGLALALLRHAFREFRRRGLARAGLGVDADSRTGANRLYEKAGMREVRAILSFERELRPGRDLASRFPPGA